ncbi:hypothetical protein RhiLY_06251 [Ceratobasidium sp. AG-Ba]|nr:hypothetical protein RhiLY_06251 [Ceratobasidium sp. AG-Ba]
MAPIRSNKSAKATTVRYDPQDARVVVDHTPKSVWGKQRVSHKLTWGHGGDRLYSYQDAIRRCDSFIRSADYAKSLDPGLPSTISPWPSGGTADGSPPTPSNALNGQPVLAPPPHQTTGEWENQGKEKAVPKWVENSTEWWFRLSDIEEMKKEWMRSLGDKGQKMAIVARVVEEWCQAPDILKSYQEVLKEISFGEVVELRAWDKGNEDLSVDMADLLLEPLDEDEDHNVKSHLPPADF